MNKTYTVNIAGLVRVLPVTPVSTDLSIASFVILGDTEIVSHSADSILPLLPAADYLITAEAKGIPFAFALAERLHMPRYIVVRKSVKSYMSDPLETQIHSITTQHEQKLYLDLDDADRIRRKRVILVDDVISTGASIAGVRRLAQQAGAEIVATACILIEGTAPEGIIHLGRLPLFDGNGDILTP